MSRLARRWARRVLNIGSPSALGAAYPDLMRQAMNAEQARIRTKIMDAAERMGESIHLSRDLTQMAWPTLTPYLIVQEDFMTGLTDPFLPGHDHTWPPCGVDCPSNPERETAMPERDPEDTYLILIGGQTMTQAQYDAARYPLLAQQPVSLASMSAEEAQDHRASQDRDPWAENSTLTGQAPDQFGEYETGAATSTESGVKGQAEQGVQFHDDLAGSILQSGVQSFPPETRVTIRLETDGGDVLEFTTSTAADTLRPGEQVDHGKMLDLAYKAMDAVLHRPEPFQPF